MNKLKMHTANKADENFAKLAELFPNALTETIDENGEIVRAIDKDILMQEINTTVVEGSEERYQFTWPDKKKSMLLANAPLAKTLRPCPEESVNFDTTENLYIEGDNLEVLKLLQETYLGKVKMIYIDPPYNTGNDFVYEDDFAQSTEEYMENSGQYDEEGNRLVKNLDTNGRFHTDWLNMMYPRLKLAKDLLRDDGVIFISIDDNEQENLKKICDEIFGAGNFVAQIVWQKRKGGGNDTMFIGVDHEYILVYAKSIYSQPTAWRVKYDIEYLKRYNREDKNGKYYHDTLSRPGLKNPIIYDVTCPDGSIIRNGTWQISKESFSNGLKTGDVTFVENKNGGYTVMRKVRQPEGKVFRSIVTSSSNKNAADDMEFIFGAKKTFSSPKPRMLISELLEICTSKDSIILDFFSGSATTAHAVMQLNAEEKQNLELSIENLDKSDPDYDTKLSDLKSQLSKAGNRKFIMVQLPELTDEKSEAYKAGYKNICEIGKERIRRAGKKIKEDNKDKEGIENLDIGFRVLKCDTTNMKDVYYNPADYNADMFDSLTSNIKEDRSPEDLLFQVMLDLGVLLSSKIEKTNLNGKNVFNVADGFLIACFDENVTEETITEIAKQKPYYFVMRDSSLENDNLATNFEQIFVSYSPDTVKKVL